MNALETGTELGISDALLIVALVSLLGFAFLLQLSEQPDAFLDASLHGLREALESATEFVSTLERQP